METKRTFDHTSLWESGGSGARVVDLHSVEEVTVLPGEKVVLGTDVTLVGVKWGYRPVVAGTRRGLSLKPARRYRHSVRFGEDFSFSVGDVRELAEEGTETDPDGKVYVIAKNVGKSPVEVRLLERVGLLGVERWWMRGWVLRKAERIRKIGARTRRRRNIF